MSHRSRRGNLLQSSVTATGSNFVPKSKIDPVQIAFVQELKRFIGYVDRVTKEAELNIVLGGHDEVRENSSDESPARLSNTLFNLWNSYCAKLEREYFLTQLINTGDYLLKMKEYDVAKQHCYGYYLRLLKEGALADSYADINFPTGFQDEQRVRETSQAIFGNGVCTLKHLESVDPHMNREATVRDLLQVLDDFRHLTQHLIPHERYCWLVFNGTVHIYKMAKWLVERGHTAGTLQYLVWCCVCLESVVPLMTLRFLSWRGSLYNAVCRCYLDLNESHAAEMFARRALQKVHQLAKIEEQSMSEATPESEAIFREVTVKLSAVVFKRVVFESRRPKKIVHRPKTRQNLKELQMLPFPRTATEKLVLDMFEGSASQFLAILEALSDHSLRTCMHAPPKLDTTEGGDSLMDVWGELVLAGYELVSRCETFPEVPLIQLARKGGDEISLCGVMKFIKLIFNYEFWEYHNLTVSHLLPVVEKMDESSIERRYIKDTISLLDAMRNIAPEDRRDTRPSTCLVDNYLDNGTSPAITPTLETLGTYSPRTRRRSVHGYLKVEEMPSLVQLCAVLRRIQQSEASEVFVKEQGDMLVDAVLLLLYGLKDHFSRLVSPSTVKPYLVAENKEELLSLMKSSNDLSLWLGLYQIDPLLPGELALKTALLLEATAKKLDTSLFGHRFAHQDKQSKVQGLLAEGILVLRNNMGAIGAVRGEKEISERPGCDPLLLVVDPSLTKPTEDTAHGISVADLQLEMICVYQRLRLQFIRAEERQKVFDWCNKNTLFLSITHMQLATLEPKQAEKHLKESFQLLQKSWSEEKRLHGSLSGTEQVGAVPCPPLLTSRTSTSMTFKPAPYRPPAGVLVKWYRLYGRSSSGSNIKVRLNDKLYPGLAMEVKAEPGKELVVSNLNPYEKYQFAVAAFDEQGRLVGGSIGQSSRPILASPPFSNLTAAGHLIQICHKQRVLSVAAEASSILWNFFVLPNHATNKTDVSVPTLNLRHVSGASITLTRHLIESILVSVDISIREGALFCNVTSDHGPLKHKQLARLGLCEKLLVAIELSGRINDTQLGTQAIIQTYGLLAPLIHHGIKCYPALKILLYCHAALTELPGVVKQKKHAGNIQHMTGVITFYLSKTLHQWGELEGAGLINENGHELLTQFDSLYDELSEQSHAITPNNKKKPVKRPDLPSKDRKGNLKDMIQEPGGAPILKSDTVKSFEAHVLRHSAIYPTNTSGDPEFSGQEDFNLLYTAVANMSSSQAQKEVYKFRRRSRFLELYVQVLEKALLECRPDLVIEWCGEASTWLTRRNDLLVAAKTATHRPAITRNLEMLKQSMLKGSDHNIIKKGETKAGGNKNTKKEVAAELLRAMLPDVWKRSCRLQRLRLITHEETPWRAQLNVILGASCYHQFNEKLDAKLKSLTENSPEEGGDYESLPASMFVVGDVGCMMNTNEEHIEELISDQAPPVISPSFERERTNLTILLSKKGSISSVTSRQSKCCLSSDRTKDVKLSYSTYLVQSFLSMTQALVLAHRGQHWGLLQNIASQLWRIIMELQMKIKSMSTATKEMLGLNEVTVNELILTPIYFMSEFLLDYVENTISSNEEIEDASFIVGKPEDINGGSSLHFDKFDDNSFVHVRWLHRYVMETLRVLFVNQKFEKLAYIGSRFNLLTNDVFGEQTYPLIIYSKRRLADRVAEYSEPWHTETSSVSVRSTITPVQAAHENLSPQVVEALRLCSVNLAVTEDQEALSAVLRVRSHTALSLHYCRQLLLCYLAGHGKGGAKQGSSPSLHPGTAGGLTGKQYDKATELFVSPLPPSSHGLIISTYEKTIEMLHVKGKVDLAVQAMHELGNVLFHSKNTKGALKWWCDALDTLLHTTNSLQNWHTFTPDLLLARCQIWGCLLGGCLASNVSQYVVNHSLDDRLDVCLLSATFFKALFHASLPHPTADHDYVTYEIGEGFNIPSLIPGIDLLSDQFRCNGSSLVAALHYVSETLVRHQYALQALPVLTLYHYISMSLLGDTKHLILARILKVQALTQLSMLYEAHRLWSMVSQSEALPIHPTSHANNISSKTNVPEFRITEPLNSPQNLRAVEHALKSKIPPITQVPFTNHLSGLAQLAHSGLLVGMANVTDVIPLHQEDRQSEAHVKYQLCHSAEVMLMHLTKVAEKEDAHYCEIEVGVAAYKLLCEIALQKQLGPSTVNLGNHGLILIQNAYNLKRNDVVTYDDICSKRRLDGLAWLQQKCLMIRGFALMTTIYGANDCKELCISTRDEAALFNSSEIDAWLCLKQHVLDISSANIFTVEKNIREKLSKLIAPSQMGAMVSVSAILYSAAQCHEKNDALSRIRKVWDLLEYEHVHYYGSKHTIATYMPTLSALAVVLESDWLISEITQDILLKVPDDVVLIKLCDLEMKLRDILSNSTVTAALRTELLLRLGVVLRAQWELDPTSGDLLVGLVKTLTECITSTNYNIALAREAYCEIAFVMGRVIQAAGTTPESSKQVTLEKRAAWSAIRSAGLCNIAQDSTKSLQQDPAFQGPVHLKELKQIPTFAALELNRSLSTKLLEPRSKLRAPQAPAGVSWVKLLSFLETLKRDLQTQGFSGQCPISCPGLSGKIRVLQDYLSSNMPGWALTSHIPGVSRNIAYLTMGRGTSTPSSTTSRESSTAGPGGGDLADGDSEGGLVLQWFTPRLATRLQDQTKDTILLYSFNLKSVKTSSPMFTSNSFTGLRVCSASDLLSLHTKLEYAHARALIEEELGRRGEAPSTQPPSSRGSTKTSFSPEPYQPSEIKCGLVEGVAAFLGLDSTISKEVLEHPESLPSSSILQLENLFSPGSLPQHNPELCRWLLSFKKVGPPPPGKTRDTPSTTKNNK